MYCVCCGRKVKDDVELGLVDEDPRLEVEVLIDALELGGNLSKSALNVVVE